MITKSYEILKNSEKLSKCNIFLLYGENEGLKNDIVNSKFEIILHLHNFLYFYVFPDDQEKCLV